MQILLGLSIALASLFASSPTGGVDWRAVDGVPLEAASLADDGRGTPYEVMKSDNICGLDEPRQLTKPAVVDYQALIEATAEYKKLKKDKIDETSSEGITLMTKARARVLKACEAVRASQGHCSVWKVIKRRDKRAVDDITDDVKRQL
ncbi:MAG: hypothetical protein AAGG01_07980 [Planctomycetota bacterium]